MTELLSNIRRFFAELPRNERGGGAIEQALFTGLGGSGCVALTHQYADLIESGFRTVLQTMS